MNIILDIRLFRNASYDNSYNDNNKKKVKVLYVQQRSLRERLDWWHSS